MIKHNYYSPKAEELLLAGNSTICEQSLATEAVSTDDIVDGDPVDWDWDNA